MSAFPRLRMPNSICRCQSYLFAWGVWFALAAMSVPGEVGAQRDVSPEAVRAEAMQAFDEGQWELAHRRMAELLSLDGTDASLQMRYAATLLHDVRTRDEGIQRLAALADAGNLQGEGWYWWGRAWMLQGEPQLAEMALRRALDEAEKKAPWREACSLALAQSLEMPLTFASRQAFRKLDAVPVPATSFHRYIQWAREGVRIMLAPQHVHSKLDKKSALSAPITFWRGEKELFFHSLGAKGAQGLELCIATLDGEGEFSETAALPAHVNSPYDDLNPVWDPSNQCLVFASNRPGTVGGFDLFETCRLNGTWSTPTSLGPMFNSVHDDLAYYPPQGDMSGWLVTGRQGEYGGVEVWEVALEGAPRIPVNLNTQWAVSGEVVPGTLTLSDAQTNESLAVVGLAQDRGQWNVVVGAGQVLRYAYETTNGDLIEGTYAVPLADAPASVTQAMVMTTVDGAPFLDARPLTQEAVPNPELSWGWDLVLDQIRTVEVEAWEPQVDMSEVDAVAEVTPKRRVVQFQSYPWWTEVQKEERAIAASILSKHVAPRGSHVPQVQDYDALSSYQAALEQASEDVMSEAVSAVLSVAASRVILDETPWEEALSLAMNRATSLWPVGSINVEEVARKAKRAWARSGALHDQGALPEVRDKRGLVGDGEWIEKPWKDGQVAKLSESMRQLSQMEPRSVKLAWCLAHDPQVLASWDAGWFNPEVWDEDALRKRLSSGASTSSSELENIRTRLSMIEMMEPGAVWTQDDQSQAIRAWKGLAVMASAQQESNMEVGDDIAETAVSLNASQGDDGGGSTNASGQTSTDRPSSDQSAGSGQGDALAASLDAEWRNLWLELLEKMTLAGQGDVGTGSTASRDAMPWREAMASWIAQRLEEGGSLSPDMMLQDVAQHVQATSHTDVSSHATADALEASKMRMLASLLARGKAMSNAEDAQQGLEVAWVLSSWVSNPKWRTRSPEQVQAMLSAWPAFLEKDLAAMRVQWAQQATSEGEASRENLADIPAREAANAAEVNGASQVPASATDAEEPQKAFSASMTVDSVRLSIGAKGVHMGWFRNNPQVQSLPEGTMLDAQAGANGLKRWVLVLPEQASSSEVQSIETWLMQQGIVDAYEVYRDVDGWSTSMPTSKDVLANAAQTSNATPSSTTRPAQSQASGGSQSQFGMGTEVVTATPQASTGPKASTNAEKNVTTEEEDAQMWGTDDMWSHGAPVALGNLRGTWYAVQVGAFRGTPEKEWIEQAGERLIYEPFPDGLARWYAGVRQDRQASYARKEELQQYAAFADAFVVRLRDGVREVVTPEEVAEEVAKKEAPAEGASEVAPTPSAAEAGTEAGAEAAEEAEVAPRVETQASPALVASGMVAGGEAVTWHVDIAKYYGTVPSSDVASLLFKAADWGVRSVQLFGQTTYFTRSMSDLGEAERLLEAIRAEGFVNATLVQE